MSSSGDRSLLLLLRRPPYAAVDPAETIDVGLVAAAFDLPVAVLFEGDGVWQLLAGQDGAPLGLRSHAKALEAMLEHGISAIYACAQSLAERGLDPGELPLTVASLSRIEVRDLIAAHALVVSD